MPSPNVLKRKILIKNKIEKRIDSGSQDKSRLMDKQISIDSGGTDEDSGERPANNRALTVETDDEDPMYPNGADKTVSTLNSSIDNVIYSETFKIN